MFATIPESAVDPAREGDLLDAWELTTSALPLGFIESSLPRTEDGTSRIVTVWESKEAVMAMRASGGPPAALVCSNALGPLRPSPCGPSRVSTSQSGWGDRCSCTTSHRPSDCLANTMVSRS